MLAVLTQEKWKKKKNSKISLCWKGTLSLPHFIFQWSSFLSLLFLLFESDTVGMRRTMSRLVKNRHFHIYVIIFAILLWLLFHKMKTKADKDVGMRGGSGRWWGGGRRIGKHTHCKHSWWHCFHNFLSYVRLLDNRSVRCLSSCTVHISHSHLWLLIVKNAMCNGRINNALIIRIS